MDDQNPIYEDLGASPQSGSDKDIYISLDDLADSGYTTNPTHSQAEDSKSSLLLQAAEDGNLECVTALCKYRADINAVDNSGNSALMIASAKGNLKLAQWLCKNGADVNLRAADGSTAVLKAVRSGTKDIVDLLCKHGADVNIRDQNGKCPLSCAAGRGYSKMVKTLCRSGASVDNQGKTGMTALHLGALMGCTKSTKALLDAGASPIIRNKEGNTPEMLAKSSGHNKVAQILKKCEKKPSIIKFSRNYRMHMTFRSYVRSSVDVREDDIYNDDDDDDDYRNLSVPDPRYDNLGNWESTLAVDIEAGVDPDYYNVEENDRGEPDYENPLLLLNDLQEDDAAHEPSQPSDAGDSSSSDLELLGMPNVGARCRSESEAFAGGQISPESVSVDLPGQSAVSTPSSPCIPHPPFSLPPPPTRPLPPLPKKRKPPPPPKPKLTGRKFSPGLRPEFQHQSSLERCTYHPEDDARSGYRKSSDSGDTSSLSDMEMSGLSVLERSDSEFSTDERSPSTFLPGPKILPRSSSTGQTGRIPLPPSKPLPPRPPKPNLPPSKPKYPPPPRPGSRPLSKERPQPPPKPNSRKPSGSKPRSDMQSTNYNFPSRSRAIPTPLEFRDDESIYASPIELACLASPQPSEDGDSLSDFEVSGLSSAGAQERSVPRLPSETPPPIPSRSYLARIYGVHWKNEHSGTSSGETVQSQDTRRHERYRGNDHYELTTPKQRYTVNESQNSVNQTGITHGDQTIVKQTDTTHDEQTLVKQTHEDQTFVKETHADQTFVKETHADQTLVKQINTRHDDQTFVKETDSTRHDQTYVKYTDRPLADQTFVKEVDVTHKDQTYRWQTDITRRDQTFVKQIHSTHGNQTFVNDTDQTYVKQTDISLPTTSAPPLPPRRQNTHISQDVHPVDQSPLLTGSQAIHFPTGPPPPVPQKRIQRRSSQEGNCGFIFNGQDFPTLSDFSSLLHPLESTVMNSQQRHDAQDRLCNQSSAREMPAEGGADPAGASSDQESTDPSPPLPPRAPSTPNYDETIVRPLYRTIKKSLAKLSKENSGQVGYHSQCKTSQSKKGGNISLSVHIKFCSHHQVQCQELHVEQSQFMAAQQAKLIVQEGCANHPHDHDYVFDGDDEDESHEEEEEEEEEEHVYADGESDEGEEEDFEVVDKKELDHC